MGDIIDLLYGFVLLICHNIFICLVCILLLMQMMIYDLKFYVVALQGCLGFMCPPTISYQRSLFLFQLMNLDLFSSTNATHSCDFALKVYVIFKLFYVLLYINPFCVIFWQFYIAIHLLFCIS
jgi:hypothetical protein